MSLENHRVKAFSFSLIAYAVFIVVLIFMTISYTPEEEFIAMGVDLNYGVDLVGYGNNQTLNKANPSPVTEEMAPSGSEDQTPKESKPIVKPISKQVKQNNKVVQKNTPAIKKVITSDIEDTPVRTTIKRTSTPSTRSSAPREVAQPSPPARSVDNGSIFKKRSSSSNSNGTVGAREGIGGNNNGDGSPGDVGDQGSPQGTLDGKSLYGSPGGGGTGGASVSISGWRKKNITLPKDKTNETGKIVFEVTVNDLGTLTKIRATSSTVSPTVVKFYEEV
jgi:protein TonB